MHSMNKIRHFATSSTIRQKDQFGKLIIPGGNSFTKKWQPRPPNPVQGLRPEEFTGDWTKSWTGPHTLTAAVPFDIRQGLVKNSDENEGIIPSKEANTELMKIPNFLHLTPSHIKKHCGVMKAFCTKWPSGLVNDEIIDKHYPVEVTTRDIVMSSASIRDERARKVTIRVPLSLLTQEPRSVEKMKLLAGKDRLEVDKTSGKLMLVLETDRCPLRRQNYDFLMFALTALTAESKKYHSWEAEKTESDNLQFVWKGSESEKHVTEVVQSLESSGKSEKSREVENYGAAVTDIIEKGEGEAELDQYKERVISLLGLRSAST